MRWLCALLALFAVESAAFARAQAEVLYTQGETFSTALRYVRVDRNCKVTDKDAEAAFIAFDCVEDGKSHRGTVEVFLAAATAEKRATVRVQVTLGDEPHYIENRFLELLERKLRDEHGTPAPPPPPADKPAEKPSDKPTTPKNPDGGGLPGPTFLTP